MAELPSPAGEVGNFAGQHVIAELEGIDAELLDDEAALRDVLHRALHEAGATVLELVCKRFDPQGVTVLALLSESHASLHTYPEVGSAFIDVFTCGHQAKPELATRLMAEALRASTLRTRTMHRGADSPHPWAHGKPGHTAHVHEPITHGLTRTWYVQNVVWEGDTAFQHLVIADTAQGVSLFCDNDRQSTAATQLVYHEALLVPALLLADQVRAVLVIGSSEGVVCQMAVAAGATRVDHVDIDREAVQLCAKHLPYGYSQEELRRAEQGGGTVRMHYADGWQYVADALTGRDRYDIVLVDLPDERAAEEVQHNRLYSTEFLQMCRSLLSPGGVVATQAGCPTMWRNETLIASWNRFTETFATMAYFGSDEHEWAYLFGRADRVSDPTRLMVQRLPTCPYRPVSIDADALVGCSTPPYHVRHSTPTAAPSQ